MIVMSAYYFCPVTHNVDIQWNTAAALVDDVQCITVWTQLLPSGQQQGNCPCQHRDHCHGTPTTSIDTDCVKLNGIAGQSMQLLNVQYHWHADGMICKTWCAVTPNLSHLWNTGAALFDAPHLPLWHQNGHFPHLCHWCPVWLTERQIRP